MASLLLCTALHAEKSIYIPSSMSGSDFNNTSSRWCYARSAQSENFIIFWEAGFGTNPATAPSLGGANMRVNIDGVLAVAEASFNLYADSLGFITRGQSKTDQYKMIIRLYYRSDWEASGSGEDHTIGTLNLSPSTVQPAGHTVAHEVGHCFQYQTHCDTGVNNGGYNYGYGANGSGDNGWWEQCAQWKAFYLYPNQIFTDYRFDEHLKNTFRHQIGRAHV